MKKRVEVHTPDCMDIFDRNTVAADAEGGEVCRK